MVRGLDTVVLTKDLETCNLRRGDVGAAVHCYADAKAFQVEFVTGEGETIAVVTLGEADMRPMRREEILHVRALALA